MRRRSPRPPKPRSRPSRRSPGRCRRRWPRRGPRADAARREIGNSTGAEWAKLPMPEGVRASYGDACRPVSRAPVWCTATEGGRPGGGPIMAILAPHRLPRPFTRTLALALLVVGLALVSQARVAPAARAQAPDGFDDLDDAEVAMIVVGLDTNFLRISTDSSRYAIGDAIRFCYTVPAPGPIAIYDYQPNGVVTTLISGFDDGRGDCLFGTVTPPAGRECMRIRYFLEGGSISRETCF